MKVQIWKHSLCVLQKNNCLQLDAKIPEKPYVPPMVKFRGEELCHGTAEDLFVGWLGNLDWSWRVVAGQNPAYDQFPCQYQLFYRGKAKGSFWYEPVFQVKTLEGKLVWRRRKYRVREARFQGHFTSVSWIMGLCQMSSGQLLMYLMILVGVCFIIMVLLELQVNLIPQCLLAQMGHTRMRQKGGDYFLLWKNVESKNGNFLQLIIAHARILH
ncbi:hypothetical protein LWI29_008004 [Acer saccharum]|uniref:Uncharacterized protein n=1 Tax=Acer saccharum TaxID=4024 RepID=A0AA39RC20_ACESA|nr:hypothetical protein LWI29_008004 [Acer saccharum]